MTDNRIRFVLARYEKPYMPIFGSLTPFFRLSKQQKDLNKYDDYKFKKLLLKVILKLKIYNEILIEVFLKNFIYPNLPFDYFI